MNKTFACVCACLLLGLSGVSQKTANKNRKRPPTNPCAIENLVDIDTLKHVCVYVMTNGAGPTAEINRSQVSDIKLLLVNDAPMKFSMKKHAGAPTDCPDDPFHATPHGVNAKAVYAGQISDQAAGDCAYDLEGTRVVPNLIVH